MSVETYRPRETTVRAVRLPATGQVLVLITDDTYRTVDAGAFDSVFERIEAVGRPSKTARAKARRVAERVRPIRSHTPARLRPQTEQTQRRPRVLAPEVAARKAAARHRYCELGEPMGEILRHIPKLHAAQVYRWAKVEGWTRPAVAPAPARLVRDTQQITPRREPIVAGHDAGWMQ